MASPPSRVRTLAGLALATVMLYGISYIFPEPLWALQGAGSLPGFWSYGLLITGFALTGWSLVHPQSAQLAGEGFSRRIPINLTGKTGIVLAFGALTGLLPIYADAYGDSLSIQESMNRRITTWDPAMLEGLFSVNLLDDKVGTRSMYGLLNILSYLTGANELLCLRILNLLLGMGYAWLWTSFVQRVLPAGAWRWLWVLAGLGAPWILNFAGHLEFYGPSYMLITACLLQVWQVLQKPGRGRHAGLLVLVLLAIKFHVTSFLLLFALGMALWAGEKEEKALNLSWRKLFFRVWLPLAALGAIGYAILHNTGFAGRVFTDQTLTDALLIPLATSEPAPLDRYNLLGFHHIWDYLNLILLWSPLGVIWVAGLLLLRKTARKAAGLPAKVFVTQFLIYAGAFFLLNPLLGMTIDWDLFSLPAPVFLAMGVVLTRDLARDENPAFLLPSAVGVSLLSLATLFAHESPASLADIYTQRGKWHFKTYWIASSTIFYGAANILPHEESKQQYLIRCLKDLQPWAVPGNDLEYADMLCEAGSYYYDQQQFAEALPYFQKAFAYQPDLRRNIPFLVIAAFMQGDFEEAHRHRERLIAFGLPNPEKAYRIAIHVAIEARAREDAATLCREYLTRWPENAFINRVLGRLESGDSLEVVSAMFEGK